jgi:mitochondrial fission protein ELM1
MRLNILILLAICLIFETPSWAGLRSPDQWKNIWILETEQTGEFTNRLAIAKTFPSAQIKLVTLNGLKVLTEKPQGPSEKRPDAIIHSNPTPEELRVLHDLFQQAERKTRIIMLGNDTYYNDSLVDLILIPQYTGEIKSGHSPVIRFRGHPSIVSYLRHKIDRPNTTPWWMNVMPPPILGVLVGGSTRFKSFTTSDGIDFGKRLESFAASGFGSVILSSSRRTPDSALMAIFQQLAHTPLIFIDGKGTRLPDPEIGMSKEMFDILAHADQLLVTGDSLSMLSDAVATGKPVWVYADEKFLEPRHQRLILEYHRLGLIKILGDTYESFSPNKVPNFAEEIHQCILKYFLSEQKFDEPLSCREILKSTKII